jgi:hypothetical protein
MQKSSNNTEPPVELQFRNIMSAPTRTWLDWLRQHPNDVTQAVTNCHIHFVAQVVCTWLVRWTVVLPGPLRLFECDFVPPVVKSQGNGGDPQGVLVAGGLRRLLLTA